MRALGEMQAARCEYATKPRCKCRCGGTLHGARRVNDVTALPPADPHHVEPKPRPTQEGLL